MEPVHDPISLAVAHVWERLARYGYRPELITARESLRIVPMGVDDREAYRVAWDERSAEVIRMGSLGKIQVSVDGAFRGSSTSARLLEDEIERRGLQDDYVYALAGGDGDFILSLSEVWPLIRATPEQRARAFLKVIEAMS